MRRKLYAAIAVLLVVGTALSACGTATTATPTAAPATSAPEPTAVPATAEAPTAEPTAAPVADRPIKVGIVDTYSGPPAVFGNDALNGFQLALEEINREGVLGTTIEFVQRDDKYQPDTALAMAKELVLQEQVDVLVGSINSAAALSISAYAKEQQVPYVVWIAKSEKITGAAGHRYVFSTSENTAMAGKAAAQALAQKPYVNYWIAGEDYEYGHAVADSVWNNLSELKPEVAKAGETWWKTGEPDLVPYLTAVMAAKPDAIIFATGGGGMANVLKTAKSIGLTDQIPVYVHTAIDVSVLKPLGADAPEGVLGTMDYLFYYPDSPANQAFVDAYQAAYGTPPGFPAFHAYNTAHFIAAAFEKAGSLDREKFIDALEGLTIDSPSGEIEMRACDHQAILPMFLGVTTKSPDYEFLVATDIVDVAGADVMPSCEAIEAARQGQ